MAPVAGFTPDQLQAFLQTQQQQGIANPYFNQAQQLFNQSAAPISASQINQYMDPFAGQVMANLQEQQGQQMQQLTGSATQQAGGVGADRIGVAQGELARQQSLASGQTLSGIYGNALSAAQADAQRQQASAYGVGQLGGAVQNAATQGTQNLYNSGSLQQQQNQAQLNAPYQNQLAQIALPYQQAQYLAGITGGLSGALGGTTNTAQSGTGTSTGTSLGSQSGTLVGQGTSTGTSNINGTQTPAPPSLLSQIAGLGTAATGVAGAFNAFGGSNNAAGTLNLGDLGGGGFPSNITNGSARGGRINGYADGGNVAPDDYSDLPPDVAAKMRAYAAEMLPKALGSTQFSAQQQRQYPVNPYLPSPTQMPSGQIGPDGTVRGFAAGGDTTGSAPSWMAADPTVPIEAIQPSEAHHGSIPTLDIHEAPMAAANAAPVQAMPMAGLAIHPAGLPNSSSAAASNPMGDIANIAKSVAAIAPLLSRGGAVNAASPYQGFADGGDTGDIDFTDRYAPTFPGGRHDAPALSFEERASPVIKALKDGTFDTYGANTQNGPLQTFQRAPVPLPQSRPPGAPEPVMAAGDDTAPAAATPTSSPARSISGGLSPVADQVAADNAKAGLNLPNVPYPDLDHSSNVSRDFARSPWLALMNAGFGMMAGTSPYAGVNIGKGLLTGTETLAKQREADKGEEEINQRAKQLALTAQQHLDTMTKITPAQALTAETARNTLDQNKWQLVYDPQSGTPYWSKQGETPIPALPGSHPPASGTAPPAASVPPASPTGTPIAGSAPPAGAVSPAMSPDLAKNFATYTPPAATPDHGPGPGVYNPKTGALAADHVQITRKVVDDATTKGEAAADAAIQLGHLKQALDQLDALKAQAGGLLQTGAYATQRLAIAKTLQMAGVPIDPNQIGSAEEAVKISTRLGQAQARLLGAREASQVIQQSIEANPGINTTPQGRQYMMATMDASIRRQQEYSQFVNDYRRQWRTAAGAEAEFNKQNPPEKYIVQAGIATAPPQFQAPEAFQNAVKRLRENPNDPKVVDLFNKIYHGTASYFLKGQQQ